MLFFVCATVIFAQTRQSSDVNFNKVQSEVNVNLNTDKAVGDTLMYFDGYYIWVADPADQALFDVVPEELSGQALHATPIGWGLTAEWGIYIDDVVGTDTTFCWISCSWFATPAAANNWIYFGPVTIPATGGKLKWEHKMPDDQYSDGYKVYMATTGMTLSDFYGTTPVFTRADNAANAWQDTVWQSKTIDIPSAYAGQQAYFGFNHDANNMFLLYLSRWLVTEANNVGISELNNALTVSQNFPNPVENTTMFSYQLERTANVTVDVLDITGRVVMTMNEGMKSGVNHVTIDAENLPNGTYFYTLTAGDTKVTKKMVVVK